MATPPDPEATPMKPHTLCNCPPDCDHWLYNEEDEDSGGTTHEGSGDGDNY